MGDDYDNIPGLTSIRCYNQLDKDSFSSGNYQECSQFNNDSDGYSEPCLLCLSLTGNLKNYKNLDYFEELNSHKCNYLNLWAYYRLSKLQGEEYKKMRKFIIDHWYNYKDYGICNSTDFVLYLTSDAAYKKAKRLYDYSLNYYKLKERHYDNDIPCTLKEQEYIRKSIELYQGIKEECEDINKALISYCRAYNEIKKIHPNDVLVNLQCKRVDNGTESSSGARNEPREMEELQHGLQGVGPHRKVAKEFTSGLAPPEVGSSTDSHKAVVTTVPILAISSISFLLYKFTGLGSMARNFLRKKGINGINSQEELTHELLENTYDDNAYPDLTETYIGYQAT
ncbi:PIR Superfamily Protein [Plasmodium ovale wallikeri]|uniref:PIR Superfamily Protein n=1 Tax=Plasmodium ovale wallikeri TaxID=864142 RepID=A0A1A9ASE6_PLAOA|nr:PIR Superfamily Protein [Plasmodium ovale wallikeri]